jgi:hypothetical protein
MYRAEMIVGRMVRKQLYIEQKHDERLKQYARTSVRSQADVVRQAVEQYAAPKPAELAGDPRAWADALAFMRSLASRRRKPGRAAVSREDLYEEALARRGSRAR